MPETRLQKARATLPEGYQFGDASAGHRVLLLEPDEFVPFGGLRSDVEVIQKKYPCPLCVGGALAR